MKHEDIDRDLDDYLSGQLSKDREEEIQEHIESCPECKEILQLHHIIEKEAGHKVINLFEPHPSADEIVQYALDRDSISPEDLNYLEKHIGRCENCQEDVRRAGEPIPESDGVLSVQDLKKEALRVPPQVEESRGGIVSFFSRPITVPAAVPLAAAALLILLLYPAYLGINKSISRHMGGAPVTLYLEGAPLTRGGDEIILRGGPPTASVRVPAGRDFLSLLLRGERESLPAPDSSEQVELTLESTADRATVWSALERFSDIYEEESNLINVLIPANILDEQEYVFRIFNTEKQKTEFSNRFSVLR